MCTVSFLPKSSGFYLAMNRDEKRESFVAIDPAIVELGRHRAILPRELSGGTWISANDSGLCLALINWHRIERQPKSQPLSRGLVVNEWRWNLRRLAIRNHEWRRQHWFSSGFDEDRAEVERQRVCEDANDRDSADSLMWLRGLHASHAPKQGPFSICMHRGDATTVSYSEVAVGPRSDAMRYKNGSLCSQRSTMTKPCKLSNLCPTNQ